MEPNFIIIPQDDPAERLRAAFPDIWDELLTYYADADTPYLLYSGFAHWLLEHDGEAIWARAYHFFNEIAESGSDTLTATFEQLCDSDRAEKVAQNLSASARSLFDRCKLS